VAPQIGLLLRCSGAKADRLLDEASTLAELPDGFAALEQGLLTVEQSAAATLELGRVPDLPTRLAVWRRLLVRLQADLDSRAVLPPPRLRELLRRWVLELAPTDAVEEREEAAAARRVEYRRREDGLADIFLIGMQAALAQAVLTRIREQSAPVSLFDDRTADQRRLDAAVDLLLGRVGGHGQGRRAGACGAARWAGAGPVRVGRPVGALAVAACPGTAVPCGAQLLVHVPLGAALGTTAEVAVLSGHGPLEPDVLQELLLAAPQLRAVHVDADGVPVSVSDRVHRPQRRDRESVRRRCSTWPPSHRRHPSRDTPTTTRRHPDPTTARPHRRSPGDRPGQPSDGADPGRLGGASTGQTPGPYRPARRSVGWSRAEAPLCEFPGCGGLRRVRPRARPGVAGRADLRLPARSVLPTHHRVKQEGLDKTRAEGSAVSWTSPTGRP
jgi:hypothetical protein